MTATAYLNAYLPDDSVMEYRTTDYSEVVRFKKICEEHGIQYCVRFRKADDNRDHIVKPKSLLRRLANWIKN